MKDKVIVRADNVGDLISECARVSWRKNQLSVLEVLAEQFGPDALDTMAPEELIAYGFAQGVGHVIMHLSTGELCPELRDPRRPHPSLPRPRHREEN